MMLVLTVIPYTEPRRDQIEHQRPQKNPTMEIGVDGFVVLSKMVQGNWYRVLSTLYPVLNTLYQLCFLHSLIQRSHEQLTGKVMFRLNGIAMDTYRKILGHHPTCHGTPSHGSKRKCSQWDWCLLACLAGAGGSVG